MASVTIDKRRGRFSLLYFIVTKRKADGPSIADKGLDLLLWPFRLQQSDSTLAVFILARPLLSYFFWEYFLLKLHKVPGSNHGQAKAPLMYA